ncbi:MAG TPA: hypothetical protein VK119_08850 [Bacillota bacterium]|nr:hypothetical protein [Bacillota bacterium]
MKEQMRSFSYGLFAAGIIIIITFFFVDQPKKNAKEMTIDDMIDEMKDEGYRVISEAEYISLAVNEDSDADANDEEDAEKDDRKSDDQDSQEKDKQSSSKDEGDDKKKQDRKEKSKDDKKEDKKEDKKSSKEYTLHIRSGMASSEIGTMLAENNIVKDAQKFNKFLKDNDYDERVQLGKFKVSSDMNFREIAEKITK